MCRNDSFLYQSINAYHVAEFECVCINTPGKYVPTNVISHYICHNTKIKPTKINMHMACAHIRTYTFTSISVVCDTHILSMYHVSPCKLQHDTILYCNALICDEKNEIFQESWIVGYPNSDMLKYFPGYFANINLPVNLCISSARIV